jgi:hypothetical protein
VITKDKVLKKYTMDSAAGRTPDVFFAHSEVKGKVKARYGLPKKMEKKDGKIYPRRSDKCYV